MTSEFNLVWSAPTVQNTKNGVRNLRTAVPTEEFWSAWRRSKEGLKAKGYSVSRLAAGGDWQVCHWQIPTPSPTAPEAPPPLAAAQPLVRDAGLLPYQRPAVAGLLRAIRQHGSALDASDTGTGKTFSAIAVARELGIVPLVICPKAVIPSWHRAARHLGHAVNAVNYEKVRTGNTPWGKWVPVKGLNNVERFTWSQQVPMLIFDEAHRCKSTKSQNADLLIGAALQGLPTIAASATAATNPLEMRALGFLLGLHGLRDFWTWAEAHGCYRNQWDGWEFGGADHDIQSIHRQVFPGRGVRVRISDLGDAFPKTQIDTELIPVASPDQIDRAYASVREAIADVHAKATQDSNGAEHLTAQLRARQVSELQKIPALVELAKDAIAERRSVFIGVNFSDSIDAVRASLKDIPSSIIRGDQTADERQRNIDAFQADKTRVCIANLRAGGVGVSLHDLRGQFPRTALICPGWSPTDLKQALGRVHRAGGKSTSIQRILYAADTVEERVAERIQERLRNLAILNDGVEVNLTETDLEP
jgi:superfamily II DNA or RNA helicase